MSAYVVEMEVIQAIVNYADIKERGNISIEGKKYSVNTLGQILVDENYRSVNFRYSEESKPETYVHRSLFNNAFYFKNVSKENSLLEKADIKVISALNPAFILGLISNYEYQACESDDWGSTLAKKIIEAVRYRCISDLTSDMPWGFNLKASNQLGIRYRELVNEEIIKTSSIH